MRIKHNKGGSVRKVIRGILGLYVRSELTFFKTKTIAILYRTRNKLVHGTFDYFDSVLIETATACNRKCSYCPNSIYDRGDIKNNKLMDLKLYQNIIDQLAAIKFKGIIKPFNFNEPLLDKRILEIVRYTRKKLPKSRIHIATNGDYLTYDMYNKLVHAGVNSINITTHMRERPKHIVELFEKLKKDKRKVRLEYISIDKEMLVNRGGLVKINKKRRMVPRCVTAPFTMHILYTGDVFLCCNDYFGKYTFGNVQEKSLEDIWFDPKHTKIRKELRRGNFTLDICRECVKLEE